MRITEDREELRWFKPVVSGHQCGADCRKQGMQPLLSGQITFALAHVRHLSDRFMVVSVSSLQGGDRLQPLRSGPRSDPHAAGLNNFRSLKCSQHE